MTAALAQAWAHGPGKQVVPEPVRPAAVESRPTGQPWSALPVSLAYALRAALAPQWWDLWTRHNDHRACPSARSARAHHAYLQLGRRRYLLDPVRELLVGADLPAVRQLAVGAAVRLAVLPAPARLPRGYGPLRDALALLEVGHVAAAVVTAAGAAGLQPRAGCTASEAWVELTVGAARNAAPPPPPRRSSGADPCGLAVDPRPLPGTALAELVRAAVHPPPGSPAAGLTHRLAVHAVSGHRDGRYRLRSGAPELTRAFAAAESVAEAFRTPRAEIDAGAANIAWALTADIAATVRAGGAEQYPRLLMRAGAAAQHLAEAAARHGLFCRPTRAFEEPELEAALGCPSGEDVLYLLLIGRGRAHAPAWDLTPVDPRGDR